MKGKVYSIALALMITFVLCGCGVSEKTETEIKDDLGADLSVLGTRTDIVLQTIEITKRQTDQGSKTDKVYVDFSLRTEDGIAEGSGSCVMNYTLYNNGWMLDDVAVERIEYKPLKGADYSDDEIADGARSMFCGDASSSAVEVTGRTTDLENGIDQYLVTINNQYKYMKETLERGIEFQFDTQGGCWYMGTTFELDTKEEWNFEGEYEHGGLIVVLKNKLALEDVEGSYGYYKSDEYREKERSWMGDLIWSTKHLCTLSKYSRQEFWGSVVPALDYNMKNKTLCYVVEDRFSVNFDYNRYDFCLLLRKTHDKPIMVFIGKNDIVYANNFEADEYKRVVTVKTVPLLQIG